MKKIQNNHGFYVVHSKLKHANAEEFSIDEKTAKESIREKAEKKAEQLSAKTLEELEELAWSGDTYAALYLGRLYYSGKGVEQSHFMASFWLTWASRTDKLFKYYFQWKSLL